MSDEEDDAMSDDEYEYDSGFEDFEEVVVKEKEYSCLEPEDLMNVQKDQLTEVAELLACSISVAGALMRCFRWDKEKLVTAVMDDPERTYSKAGIFTGADQSIIAATAMEPIKCLICLEQCTGYSALGCGHKFCNDCYRNYMTLKIRDEGLACIFATCPSTPKCSVTVSEELCKGLVTEEMFKRYQSFLARSFIDDNDAVKWCPAPNCGRAISIKNADRIGVKCSCGHKFCFQCGLDAHAPADCEQVKKWMIKCRDDSETYNWLMANTKTCPKCATAIEKNGGCNHMTCKNASCKFEFCWVCRGPWKDHSGSYYSCNRYDPDNTETDKNGKKTKVDESRAALERYLHYYTRFINHHNSLKMEKQTRDQMENKIDEMQKLGDNTWLDVQYLKEATDQLLDCRYTLQYTYVYAYYLPAEGNKKPLFEMEQTNLEQETEKLSEMLEQDVEKIERMQVVHCFQMAKKRLQNLLQLVYSGQDGQSSDVPMVT